MKGDTSPFFMIFILLGIQISFLFALLVTLIPLKVLADQLAIQPFWPIAVLALMAGNALIFYRVYKHDNNK